MLFWGQTWMKCEISKGRGMSNTNFGTGLSYSMFAILAYMDSIFNGVTLTAKCSASNNQTF